LDYGPTDLNTVNTVNVTTELKGFCALDEAVLELLKMAMTELKLSARACDRILKIARTIADLAGSDRLTSDHPSEAIQYRSTWGVFEVRRLV